MGKVELIKQSAESVGNLTESANKKTLAYCLVFSILFNVWQGYNNDRLTSRLLDTSEDLNEKRVQEIKEVVRGEVTQQVRPISNKVDTIRQSADSTFNIVKEKVNSIVK